MRQILLLIAGLLICVSTVRVGAAPPSEGLVLWLDASDVDGDGNSANNPKQDGSLSMWVDKSGRGNHVEQDAANRRPTYQTDGLSGRPAVRFHGDDLLDRAHFQGLAPGDQLFHVLIVMRAAGDSSHSAQRLIDLQSRPPGAEGESAKRRGFWVGTQSGRRKVRFGIADGDEGEGRGIAWNGMPNLIEVVYTGQQTFEIFLNGTRERRAMFNGTHFLGFERQVTFALGQHFGLENNEGTYYQGDMAEILIYNRPLSATERYDAGEYLTKKYSLEAKYRPIPQFETDVLPILAQHCHQCHGEQTQDAELDLRTVSAMLRGGKAGPVIVRGFPTRSEMISLIESGKMPPEEEDRLTVKQIAILRDWVAADAPSKEIILVNAVQSKISEKDRAHWAYQSPVRHQPPKVRQTNRVRNAVDRFILNRLEEQKLTLSDEADRSRLLRRAYFDLIGLPPSPQEVDTFLNDNRPDAYERLIDRLLQSEHFGERWGRYWLDVSGYVDVYGSDNDAAIIKPLPGKWRYRDYVIQSFNRDKPFDRFIVEQLAGDELYDWRTAERFTPEMLEALIATNFLLCANDDTDQNELNTPDVRHHVLQRTTEVVAGNLLALTMQCAKCHDHKYEAIPQEDYYRLEAIFSPAFNVNQWVVSTAKSRPDVSDSEKSQIDQLNSEIDRIVAAFKKNEAELQNPYKQHLFDQKLAKLPDSIRNAVKTAVQTPPGKRSDQQKLLAKKYQHTLSVSEGEIDASFSKPHRAELQELRKRISEANGRRKSYGTVQVVQEPNPPPATYVLRRGDYLRPGLEVQPGLLSILRSSNSPRSVAKVKPAGNSSGRRLTLARQLTDSNTSAGQYVARVIVNRIWQQVFGKGIVETSDNFGVSGMPPTHPELLDWLTIEFLRRGWRVKPIIRLLMTSSTYRQKSALGPDSVTAEKVDPANRLLWRMNLRRLDSEYVRDAILAVSGSLNRSLYGPPLPLHVRPDGMVVIKEDGLPTPASKYRRSIYILARRNYHLTMLRVFDQPIVATHCTVRKPSAVVTQSLTLLHDDFVVEQAGLFADRVIRRAEHQTGQQQIETAFRIALGRPPDNEELKWSVDLLRRHVEQLLQGKTTNDEAHRIALTHLCHMLFNTNEFLYFE